MLRLDIILNSADDSPASASEGEMTPKRAEPFHTALSTLRWRLREGAYGPGARLAATEIAEDLRLSPTPVREALSRLAGEGLVEDRRGQGVFVRRLTAADLACLQRLHHALLRIALDHPRRTIEPDPGGPPAGPVEATEHLFARWVAAAGSRALAHTHRKVQDQLGPARRLEPAVFGDLEAEAHGLVAAAGDRSLLQSRVRAFHLRRVRACDQLADLLETRAEGIGPI